MCIRDRGNTGMDMKDQKLATEIAEERMTLIAPLDVYKRQHTIPLQSKCLRPAKPRIQANHNEQIGWQPLDCIQ